MVNDKTIRLTVNVNDIRRKNPIRAQSLLNNSFEEQLAFQKALKEYVLTVAPDYGKCVEEFFIAFEGSFGNKHVTPRSLTSRYLGNLVSVEGIVTKCKNIESWWFFVNYFMGLLLGSLIHPKVVRSVHFCPETNKTMERRYTDLTSLHAYPSSAAYPTTVCLYK